MKSEESEERRRKSCKEPAAEEYCEEPFEEPSSGPGVLRCGWLALVLFPTLVAGSFGLLFGSLLECPAVRGPARVRVLWPGFSVYIWCSCVLAWTFVCIYWCVRVFVWTFRVGSSQIGTNSGTFYLFYN